MALGTMMMAACAITCMNATVHGQLSTVAIPQEDLPSIQTQHQALAEFQACYGTDWTCHQNLGDGLIRTLSGGRALVPGVLDEPIETALQFLESNRTLLGLDRPEDSFRYVKTHGRRTEQAVEFNQLYKDTPVWFRRAIVRIADDGAVIRVTSGLWPVGDIDVEPRITKARAARIVARSWPGELVTPTGPTELVIMPRKDGILAWHSVDEVGTGKRPIRHFVDAMTGALVEWQDLTISVQEPPKKRISLDPETVETPLGLGGLADPCVHYWYWVGPVAEDVVFTPEYANGDPYSVNIRVGATSWNALEDGTQALAVYGANCTLLPGITWDIGIDWSIWSWDSYNEPAEVPGEFNGGHWDVFFTTLNSNHNFWTLTNGDPVAERACDFAWTWSETIGPGNFLTIGGYDWDDGNLCTLANTESLTWTEADLTKISILSLGLDTGRTGQIDGRFPSWGEFDVEITAPSHYFNPNPMVVLDNPNLSDDGDSHAAVAMGGYATMEGVLPRLNDADPAFGYRLQGDYCSITPVSGTGALAATSHDGQFPYLRGCDQFEGVNCYIHITEYQLYLQSLGFTGPDSINDRAIEVDPHSGGDQGAAYVGDGAGTGRLIFGDGGVDAAEDGDVIIHEYAHACFDNVKPGVFQGSWILDGFAVNESRATNEGCADFIAASYFNASSSNVDAAAVGEWFMEDPEGLRRCDRDWTYPVDLVNHTDHEAGQIFSRFLWDLRGALGGDRTAELIYDAIADIPTPNSNFVNMVWWLRENSNDATPGGERATITNLAQTRGFLWPLNVTAEDENGVALPGVVTCTPNPGDFNLAGAAAVPFERLYPWGMLLTLTVPAVTADGRNLIGWRWNNGDLVELGNATVVVTMRDLVAHNSAVVYGPPTLICDFNGDGNVDGTDLAILLGGWGTADGDVDGDGTTNGVDLSLLLGSWTV